MRLIPVLALTAALATGACANPDGSLNVPGTLALGAGVAIAGVALASASQPRYSNNYYYQQPRYGRGYGHGYRHPGYGYGRQAYAGNHGYRRW